MNEILRCILFVGAPFESQFQFSVQAFATEFNRFSTKRLQTPTQLEKKFNFNWYIWRMFNVISLAFNGNNWTN